MTKSTFNALINRLHIYFRRKEPHKDAKAQWYKRVKDIKEQAVNYIEAAIQEERDSLPSNIPKVMRQYYVEWQMRHRKDEDRWIIKPCDACNNTGLIWGRKAYKDTDTHYTPCFRCAKCLNWKQHKLGEKILKKMPQVTIDDLRNMGYDPVIVPKSTPIGQNGE